MELHMGDMGGRRDSVNQTITQPHRLGPPSTQRRSIQIRLCRSMSSLILSDSKDRDPTDLLSNLVLCLTNLMFNQKPMSYINNFLYFSCVSNSVSCLLAYSCPHLERVWAFLLSCWVAVDRRQIPLKTSPGLADPTAPASPHMAWCLLHGLGNPKLGTTLHTCQIQG